VKLTNKLGLPQPIVDAVRNDGYTKGDADMSVTELLSPPRLVALKKAHESEIEEDVSDRIWSLVGQVMHGLLERANTIGIAERRLSIMLGGWKISGGMDLFHDDGTLSDYKFVTSYKFKSAGVPLEYEQQLNCYAEILRQNGHEVKKLQIVGILRDWSKLEAMRSPDYPQTQIVIRSVQLWPSETVLGFMSTRIQLHKNALLQLPNCADVDRWAKPDTFAVMKDGAKRAVRVLESKEEADALAATNAKYSVVARKGENTRCDHYCPVRQFCSQAQSLSQAQGTEEPITAIAEETAS
jgi:hypothetical protein